jgi:predicted house-cleaning NTP pyrophosphatase (Maf/HAM1 superfamily)
LKNTILYWRSYPGIMGLPMFETAQLLRQLGMNC